MSSSAAAKGGGGAKSRKSGKSSATPSSNSTTNNDSPLNPKRTAQQYSDPAPFRMKPGTMATVPSAQALGWSTITLANFHRHPYITYAAPVLLLAMGWSAVQVTSTRAAEPILGAVLAYRNIDTVTAFCLLPTWIASRVWVQWSNRRDLRKRGLGAAIAQSGFAALTPDRIDSLFLLAARLVSIAALLIVAAPVSRDWMVWAAEKPRESLDKLVGTAVLPVIQAVLGKPEVATQITPTTALLGYLPTSISAPAHSLLATYLPTHKPLPAWLHPHLVYSLSLYPAAAIAGIVVALFPYLTATPLAPAHTLERHVKFSRLLVPIAWFFFSNAGRSLTQFALNRAWVYPETLLAGLGVGVAVLAGILIPLAYPTYTKTRGGYVHYVLALLSVSLVTYLTLSSQGHYTRDVFDSVALNDDYTLVAKRGPVMILTDSSRNIQVMRAGHSLLGGTYTRGNDAGDSVFYGFYYHDAHRLVRDRPLNAVVDQGKDAAREGVKGLMIGYGIGVAAHAYVHSGVPLDIVELDKHVVDLARAYFPLPAGPHGDVANATFHVADGRAFVEYTRGASYDFVIHDVFSGGSVPSSLFTWETFAHMRRVLKPAGTLSVNFVGRAHEMAFRHVAKTLRAVFPYVRCFAEMPEKKDDEADAEAVAGNDDVANYVFYASSQPMDFRPPETRDAFNSMMRTYALHKRMENEVVLPGPPLANAESKADLVARRRNVTTEAELTQDDLYYEFRGYGDLWAATTEDEEFCDPTAPPSDDGRYKLAVTRPGRVKRQPTAKGGPSSEVVAAMPHVLVDGGDEDAGDRLADGLVGVAWSHYRIMREVVPLDVWLVY